MATDKLLYEYAVYFTRAFAKFIGVKDGEYQVKSITLKATEKRTDLFLISPSGVYVVLVETQGYDDEYLSHRMVAALMLYCLQHKYTGEIDAAVIFLEESNYRAASLLERQFAQTAALKFSPKTIVIRRFKVEALSQLNDVHLTPLYPLCDISPEEIERQAPIWSQKLKTAPDLQEEERKNLLGLLGGFIAHRIKNLPKAVLNKLLGGFVMEETLVGQEIMRDRTQSILFKLIAARFGTVPEELWQKILAVTDMENLDQIATALLTIQSGDDLRALVN